MHQGRADARGGNCYNRMILVIGHRGRWSGSSVAEGTEEAARTHRIQKQVGVQENRLTRPSQALAES